MNSAFSQSLSVNSLGWRTRGEREGNASHFRLDYATRNDLTARNNEAKELGNSPSTRKRYLGSLSNYDDDDNDNVKKTIGFISKTTALHVHHAF